MLSVIILTRNEEKWLEGALKTASFADEVVIIDNGSSDNTLKIAKKYTARIFSTPCHSFAKLRNLGLEKARGNWIFYLDADERITEELEKELIAITKNKNNKLNSYIVPRKNFYFGYRFKYGHSYPDYQHRFFRKEALMKWKKPLHEEPVLKNKSVSPGCLSNHLWHFSHRDIKSMIDKTNSWSLIEAKELLAANHPKMVGWRFFSVLAKSFFRQFVKFQCWRDGTKGIVEGLFQVFSNFISYAKLWELQQKENALERYKKLENKITSK